MPSSFTRAVANTSAQTITTTTELAILTSDILTTTNQGGEGNVIYGMINVATGAGTTATVVRVRQGTGITGTVVGTAQTTTTAASTTFTIPFWALDSVNSTASQYTVTIQQTSATGNGTVNQVFMNLDQATSAN